MRKGIENDEYLEYAYVMGTRVSSPPPPSPPPSPPLLQPATAKPQNSNTTVQATDSFSPRDAAQGRYLYGSSLATVRTVAAAGKLCCMCVDPQGIK